MKISDLLGFRSSFEPVLELLIACVAQITLYFVACGIVACAIAVWSAIGVGQLIDPGPRRPFQIMEEIKWSLLTCLIIGSFFFGAIGFVGDVYPTSTGNAALNIIGFLVIYDLYMYVTHRFLHTRLLARFHNRHHKAVRATPWSSLNMHPVEAIINYFPFFAFAAVSNVSLLALLGIHAYLMFGIANSHGNYNLLARTRTIPLLHELVTFHQGHHSKPSSNYGFLFTHWDFIFGTRSRAD